MTDEKRCPEKTKSGERCEKERGHSGYHTYCGYYGTGSGQQCVYQTSWLTETTVKVTSP